MDRFVAMEMFIGVFETGSFSGGARRMNVGQPAVSKSIAQLEEKLRVRLFLRSTRGLTPTEAGQRFYERAKRAIEEADEAERAAMDSAAKLTGKLRVCAAITFARLHVVPAVNIFLERHPDLTLDVVLDDRKIDLVEEGIDVALRMGALDDSSMTARKLGESRRLIVGTPAYFAAAGIPQVPADLMAHQAIIQEQRGVANTWTFQRNGTEASVAMSGRMSVSAAEGVRAAVLADMGVAVASEWMFDPELTSGKVQPVLTDWTLPPVALWAVFPTGRMINAKTRAFIAFVEEILGLRTTNIS